MVERVQPTVMRPITVIDEEEIEDVGGATRLRDRTAKVFSKAKQLTKKTPSTVRKLHVDPHNVEYHIIIGKFSNDSRQTENENETTERAEERQKKVYVKCIQTSTSLDQFQKYLGLAKTKQMQKVISSAKTLLGTVKNLNIPDLELKDDYDFAQDIIVGNDILQVKATRAIQEVGGLFIIELHNKGGLYNDVFVKGDFVEIRTGYRGAEGTDYELQTIMQGIISSVRMRINNNEEVIVIHGKDYQNVLRDKSLRDVIIQDPVSSTDPITGQVVEGARSHDMKSVLMGFHQTFTRDFGHPSADILYRQLRSGEENSIFDDRGIPEVPAGAHSSFTSFMESDGEDFPIIENMANSPLADSGYWDFLQQQLMGYGYYMRLKKSSVRGRRFSRANPQLVIMPMNVLSSDAKNFVERYDEPHDFRMGGSPTLHFEGNIEEMEIYEDTTFMKNRIVFKLKLPVIERYEVQDEGTTSYEYWLESRVVYLDSDILLFPKNYKNTQRFAAANPYFEVNSNDEYILKLQNKNREGDEDTIAISPFISTSEGSLNYKDIPIREKDGRKIGLGKLININQQKFGKRTIILAKDCLPLVQDLFQEDARAIGLTDDTLSYSTQLPNDLNLPFRYKKAIEETIKQIIQILIEHIYAIKGNITLSRGNPSVDLFHCCTVTDKRVLNKLQGSAAKVIQNISYPKDVDGVLKRTKGVKHLFTPTLAPMNSIGTFMSEFRLDSPMNVGNERRVRTPRGDPVDYLSSFVYGDSTPEQRFVISYVDHVINASGYFTKLRFQLLPQYYPSEFLKQYTDNENSPHRVERDRLQQILNARNNKLYLGKVIIPKIDESHEYSYLTFMEGSSWDSGVERTRGAPTEEVYFDRAIVSINMEDGGTTREVVASVVRQPHFYTPIKPNDTVLLATAQALQNRTGTPTIQKGWVILGVVPTSSSFLETSVGSRILSEGIKGYNENDIHLSKTYKTGFQSSFVDLITGINRHNQDTVLIINHDYQTYRNNSIEATNAGNKANISTKVGIASISKRQGTPIRRQKSSLNLNANQPTAVGDVTKGTAVAELATYEVDDSTGEGATDKSYASLQMTRKDENNKAKVTLKAKGTASTPATTKQSTLSLDGEGNLSISADTMTYLGIEKKDATDQNCRIVALDGDYIVVDSAFATLIDEICQALFAVPTGLLGNLGAPLIPSTYTENIASVTLAYSTWLANVATAGEGTGTETIGLISTNNDNRKIKGAH